jgi:hypothetical protein
MATAAKFRIDVAIHDLLMTSARRPPTPAQAMGPEPVFPQYPQRLDDPGPDAAPEKRKWGAKDLYRATRRSLFPYVRSQVLPGQFHPITAYLFVEYKCNIDRWYCWSYNNKIKGHDQRRGPAFDRLAARNGKIKSTLGTPEKTPLIFDCSIEDYPIDGY